MPVNEDVERRGTNEALSLQALLSTALSRSAACSVEPFAGPPPSGSTRVLPPLARGDRNDILSILKARRSKLASLRSLAASLYTKWNGTGRKLFLAFIIILLLIAAYRRCRRARRFIHYLLRKLLNFYRRCWCRFYGRDKERAVTSEQGSSRSSSEDGSGHGSFHVDHTVHKPDSLRAEQGEEDECEPEGEKPTNGQRSRCRSAPASLAAPDGLIGEKVGVNADSERWSGLPHWGGFRGSPKDYAKKLGLRPSSLSVSPFPRGTDIGFQEKRGRRANGAETSRKSTSSSIHRALHDFSLYIEASANRGLHQCPAPTNTNIPSCFFLPSLISAASATPGEEAEALSAGGAEGGRAPTGAHSRFYECCCSHVAGAHSSDTGCTGSACPYSVRNGQSLIIFQEAVYSSDSTPSASVCQEESCLTRLPEDVTGHDSSSVRSPRTPGPSNGEGEVARPEREVSGFAARFRHAPASQGSAMSAAIDRDLQKILSKCVRKGPAEAANTGGPPTPVEISKVRSAQASEKIVKPKETTISSLRTRWAAVRRRLRQFYRKLLVLLRRRSRKDKPKVPQHTLSTTTSDTATTEDSGCAEEDFEATGYLRKLYRLVRLAFPRLWSYEGGCLTLLVSALVLRTFLSIWIASINGRVVQTIVQRNLGGFVRSLGVLVAYALPAAVVNAAIQFFEKMLALQLRRNLTIYFTRRYLKGLTFYRVAALDCRIPHPDEMMTASLSSFSLLTASLFSSFLKPLVDIVFLSRTLVKHLGIGAPVTLVAWYALTAFAMHTVAPPLGKRTARLQELEAKYRSLHGDVLHHSEEIAFYGGARHAERRLESAFDILYAYKRQVLMLYHLVLSSMDTLLAKHLAVVVGYAVVAGPSFRQAVGRGPLSPLKDRLFPWKTGNVGSGVVAAQVAVTHDYIRNSSLLINLAKAIGRILMAYKDVQQLGGITARLTAFLRVLEDLDSGFFCTRNILTGTLVRRSTTSTGAVRQLSTATAIQFRGVAVVTPAGQVLLDNVSFALQSGHNLFLLGPNGCGKTSLFRILGGLWPLLEGEIITPVASKLFYIPQRPYMPEGTLRDQVIYPMTYEDYRSTAANTDSIVDDQLEQLLDIVGLKYLLTRCPEGWDTWGDWEDILSGGEKQRMAFARLLFHKPVFAILDEATSAVSVDVEGALYRRCGDAKITLITISHNISLLKYHDFVLRFLGVGAPGRGWSLESTEGLKRLDSYSFLLNITPPSGQADATRLSPSGNAHKLASPPATVASSPPASTGLVSHSHRSISRDAAVTSTDPVGRHEALPHGSTRLTADVDTSGERSGFTSLPPIVMVTAASRPDTGTDNCTVLSTSCANANNRLAPLPSRESRVSSPARITGRVFPGASSALSPAAVGSAAAEATVSTIKSMRKSQQDAPDSQ